MLIIKKSVEQNYRIIFCCGEEENPRRSSGMWAGHSDFFRLAGQKDQKVQRKYGKKSKQKYKSKRSKDNIETNSLVDFFRTSEKINGSIFLFHSFRQRTFFIYQPVMKKLLFFILILCQSLRAQNFLKPEIYTLENGFTVCLLPDPKAKYTFGLVEVKAGANNDPAAATGLAHYLEHLLFKGNNRLGSIDYAREKIHLDSIRQFYRQLSASKSSEERKKINRLINQQEEKASVFGKPTEFDNLIRVIGGTDLNAFTSNDFTVFHNRFPGEQIDKWLELYAERFKNPVFRSFQSELEVVYEEKNRYADDFQTTIEERIKKELFPETPFPILGLSSHLKNPSLDSIYAFYNRWYVANNMALILVGNFDPQISKPLIKEKFSSLPVGNLPALPKPKPRPLAENKKVQIRVSPVRVKVLGYKTVPAGHPDMLSLEVLDYLLSNEGETGLLNRLSLEGRLMSCYTETEFNRNDGASFIIILPKIIGQSLKSAENLVLKELERLRMGEFSEELLEQVKNEMLRSHENSMEDPMARGLKLVSVIGY